MTSTFLEAAARSRRSCHHHCRSTHRLGARRMRPGPLGPETCEGSCSEPGPFEINPPAPKVPRRGSLAVDATGQICQTGARVQVGFFTAISNVLWLRGSCEAMLPTLGLSWAQLRRQMPPQDQVTRAKPNLGPNVPKLHHVGPRLGSSWAQVRANWPEFCASYAQVGAKWATVRPSLRPRSKFDPSRLLVGASGPTSFLSVLFPGCGRFSSRSDPNRNWNRDIYIYILL